MKTGCARFSSGTWSLRWGRLKCLENNMNAYWFKDDVLYEVPYTHIQFVLENPSLFNVSLDELLAIYKKHNEVFPHEGYARKEIIISSCLKGWIRLRFRQRGYFYVVEGFNFTEEVKQRIIEKLKEKNQSKCTTHFIDLKEYN